MIKARTLLILLAITAAIVVGAIVTSSMRGYDKPKSTEELLLPDLTDHVNDVAEVEILTADGKKVDLKHTDAGWVDASRGGYPARFEPIKQLLVSLADAKVAGHKTSDPENYKKLGVMDLKEAGAKSTSVTLIDKNGKTLASIIVGDRMKGASGRFVRMTDESEVLLTADDLNVSALPLSWLEREIMRVPRDDVQRVQIAHPDGESFTIVRKDDGTFDMIGVPEGRRVRGQSPMAGIMGALAYVDFQDVEPIADLNADDLKEPLMATYETKDGMEIDVSVWTTGHNRWTSFAVSKSPNAPAPTEAEAPADDKAAPGAPGAASAQAKAGDKAKEKPETLDEKVARLKKKLDGWVFEISPSSLVPLQTPMIELTQEIPPQQPQSGPPTPPAGQAPQPQPQPQSQPQSGASPGGG